MIDKKKLVIFPADCKCVPIINIDKFDCKYCIGQFVAPRLSNLIGKDIAYADNRPEIGFMVSDNFESALNENDALFMCDSQYKSKELVTQRNEVMDLAIGQGKDIICTDITGTNYLNSKKYEKIIPCNDKDFQEQFLIFNKSRISHNFKYHEPNCKIIFVGDLIGGSDSLDLTISICANLRKQGINVSCICREAWCTLLGMHPFPDFFSELKYPDKEKVKMLNSYINWIELTEHPQVIVINLPEPFLAYDNVVTNDFGISAFLISRAIQPTHLICATLASFSDHNFISDISKEFEYKFGFGINCVHISNGFMDGSTSHLDNSVSVVRLPYESIFASSYEEFDYNSEIYFTNFFQDQLILDRYCNKIKQELSENQPRSVLM